MTGGKAPTRPALRAGRLAGLLMLVAGCTEATTGGAGMTPVGDVVQRLPDEVAGFQRGTVTERGRLGTSLDYATPNRSAVGSVLVYARPDGRAPSDPADPAVERELSIAVQEVMDVAPARTGRRLSERERVTMAAAGLRCSMMEGAFGRAPVTRQLCIGGAGGNFVRVQVTMADRRPREVDAAAFMADVMHYARGGSAPRGGGSTGGG